MTEDIPVVFFLQKNKIMSDTFITDKNLIRTLNTTSLKCCLPSTDANDRWDKFMHA